MSQVFSLVPGRWIFLRTHNGSPTDEKCDHWFQIMDQTFWQGLFKRWTTFINMCPTFQMLAKINTQLKPDSASHFSHWQALRASVTCCRAGCHILSTAYFLQSLLSNLLSFVQYVINLTTGQTDFFFFKQNAKIKMHSESQTAKNK